MKRAYSELVSALRSYVQETVDMHEYPCFENNDEFKNNVVEKAVDKILLNMLDVDEVVCDVVDNKKE